MVESQGAENGVTSDYRRRYVRSWTGAKRRNFIPSPGRYDARGVRVEDSSSDTGRVIAGRFRILGATYRAREHKTGETVAVKVVEIN